MLMDSQMNLSNSFEFDGEDPIEIDKMENPMFVISKEIPAERSPSINSKRVNKILMGGGNLTSTRPRPNFRSLVSASGGENRSLYGSSDSSPIPHGYYQHISPKRPPEEVRFSQFNNTIRK